MGKDDAFLRRLLATFKIEAGEHIEAISSGLIEIEKTPFDRQSVRRTEVIEVVFREIHSLKGAARTVNAAPVESICQSMESIFSILKKRGLDLAPHVFDLFHKALDTIRTLLSSLEAEGKPPDKSVVKGLVRDLDGVVQDLESGSGEGRPAGREKSEEEPAVDVSTTIERGPEGPVGDVRSSIANKQPSIANPETIRVERVKLDSILRQAEGLLRAKQSAGERASEVLDIVVPLRDLAKAWSLARNDVRAVSGFLEKGPLPREAPRVYTSLARLVDFLESGRELVESVSKRLSSLERKIRDDRRSVAGMVDTLLDSTKRISMTPFSTLFDILPRMARDLLGAQGKVAEFFVSGGEVEVDRRILEEMKDPLIHLVRNSVDHGIERPEERISRGRPQGGRISISVSHSDSGKVELVVADDGPGVDVARVKGSAVRLGVVSPEDAERLDEERLRALVFRSGVSTSPLITDISGRGLGLAIVQEKVERLGGSVSCESSPVNGTLFRILLPMTVATVRGLLVRLEERLFVIPSAHVRRTVRVPLDRVKTVEGRETISFQDSAIPLVHLGAVLKIPLRERVQDSKGLLHAAMLESDDKIIAFKIDEVLHEQEFLVKGLGRQLKRVRNISGATVLSEGTLVPVLNVPDLMRSAVADGETVPSIIVRVREPDMRKTILVVEDSVTARTLLKNILEASGYDVRTATDGVDAYGLLKEEAFHLVVSDVDMPRMNGFDLTSKIRADKKLGETPVVLVTALDSREDRERGIDVGANAYIVKSSFDQSNLLEVVKRLI